MKYDNNIYFNNVELFGNLRNRGQRVKVGNENALRLIISVPNDEKSEERSNNISVYYITDDFNILRSFIGEKFMISGHIDTMYGQRIIVDQLIMVG